MSSPVAARGRNPAADALLAAALRAQSAGIVLAERKAGGAMLKIVFANDSFQAMTGHRSAQLLGRDFDALHLGDAELQRLRHWVAQARPGEPLAGEGHLVRADGRTLPASWSFDPLHDAGGAVTHVVASYWDETDKRSLMEALVHAQRLDAVGRVTGGVAHDFYNLISVINGYCEMLAAQVGPNPEAMRQLGEIHEAGRKAAALTQQLLAFSRRQPLHARVLNLNALIRDHAEILRRLIGDAGRLELELADDLANVRVDATQFQQVILNLVLNARDALRDRGRIVLATANRTLVAAAAGELPPGRYVALRVVDNGTGMDAETMKHLFEPFFTTKPEGKGTGLGLALVYGVVQQSGGTIHATSELLVGSQFEILLPAVDEPAERPRLAVAPLTPTRGSETVWLVEADEVVRKMVAGILTADGYHVTALGSGGEASSDAAALREVQLLIAPMNSAGERLARRILAQGAALRLLITGNPGETAAVGWLPAERQARLEKPYALSDLMRAARVLLDAGRPPSPA